MKPSAFFPPTQVTHNISGNIIAYTLVVSPSRAIVKSKRMTIIKKAESNNTRIEIFALLH